MIIFKPEWISHGDRTQEGTKSKKQCIYSIDIHPDGKRLATGSLDTTVKIWNTDPIYSEKAEKDTNCHKLLCTMTLHSGAVLCVRWSQDGRYLASSSDNDNVIIIWELDREAGSGSVFGSSEVNHETWRAVKYLRGHDSDVQDLAWSNNNQYIASCGVDGFVIVWDARTFEQVHKIDQHSGFVKGITWDPVGKYLASQSDDKTVKIWRTSDWQEEAEIDDPFYNAPGTTFFRRLSWSPEGSHIAAANAVNGNQCVAAVINRDRWDADISLVGHAFPIEVTSFNPKLFYLDSDDDDDDDESEGEDQAMGNSDQQNEKSLASVCALGGQDRGLSIWVTRRAQPLCVAIDVFENNVYDLSWTPDGQTLFACSQDGTVVCLQLQEELQHPAPHDEVLKKLTQYGYGRKNTQLPETPYQLDLEAESTLQSSSSSPNNNNKSQVSQRIMDIMGGSRAELSINAKGGTHTWIDEKNAPTISNAIDNNDKSSTNLPDHAFASSSSSSGNRTATEQKVTVAQNGKRRIQPIALPRPSTQAKPTNQNDSLPVTQPVRDSQLVSLNLGRKGIEGVILGNKRKIQSEDTDFNNISGNDIPMQLTMEPIKKTPVWVDAAVAPPGIGQSQVKLGLPKVKSTLMKKTASDHIGTIMECHNPSGKKDSENTKLITSRHGKVLWIDYLSSAILLMTGNELFSAVACEDASIVVYSPAGRRLIPSIILESTPVVLTCNDRWLLCLTAVGQLYTWDITHQTCELSSISIAPLLHVALAGQSDEPHIAPTLRDIRIQKNGTPLIITSYHQAFAYHQGMRCWVRISDAWYIISEIWGSGSSIIEQHPLGWLSTALTTTGSTDTANESILNLAKSDPEASGTITLSHIENQLAAALILGSTKEYNDWMVYYAKRLAKENCHSKVEELCQWLMGPPYLQLNDGEEWEPSILNSISKHDLLRKLLPVLAQNRQLQRITTEFRSLVF